jgi:hypothetical protein
MSNFVDCFNIILNGNKEASRKAARDARKMVYSSHGNQYKDIKLIIENAPKVYAKIKDDFRQENFVVAVSVMYFLHNRENQPDFLFSWLFDLLQHKNGNIRYATVRMFENEIGPLTYHIRFPNEKPCEWRNLPCEKADLILLELFVNLHNLANSLWKPVYKKYKYISSLPSGTYKSIQMILSFMEDYCGKEYIAQLVSRAT